MGLVVERKRRIDAGEVDGLRWYVDFEKCERVLYEKYFACNDLGKDLKGVVEAYRASDEFTSRVPGSHVADVPPITLDTTTTVPDPFPLKQWLDENRAKLMEGATLALFEGHPDQEFDISIVGSSSQSPSPEIVSNGVSQDTWIYQLDGSVDIKARRLIPF